MHIFEQAFSQFLAMLAQASLLDIVVQSTIAFAGVVTTWLTQSANDSTRRWACLVGLASQPAWFYSASTTGQWGIFVLSILCTISWSRGLKTYWWARLRPGKSSPAA